MKILNTLLIAVLITIPLTAQGKQDSYTKEISGTISNGLRLLDVDTESSNLEYTIYRGDYIVFNFEDKGYHELNIPELEIKEIMPKSGSKTPYVKIKKSGNYSFTLGKRKGIFHVLELVDTYYHEISASEADKLIKNINPIIIDVRTQREYEQGHISGAKLIPVQVFEQNLPKLEQFKNENILLYCASGNRSTVAAKMLIDSDFTKVYNLRHGIGEWERDGLPIK